MNASCASAVQEVECRAGGWAFMPALPRNPACFAPVVAVAHRCARNGILLGSTTTSSSAKDECALHFLGYEPVRSLQSGNDSVYHYKRGPYHFPGHHGKSVEALQDKMQERKGPQNCTADGEFELNANATWPAPHHVSFAWNMPSYYRHIVTPPLPLLARC